MTRKSSAKTLTLVLLAIAILAGNAPAATPESPQSQETPKTAATKGPVKVFILVGQSNMQGDGHLGPADKPGTLEFMVKHKDPAKAARFKHLVDADGKWVFRKDVWFFQRRTVRQGRGKNAKTETTDFASPLTAGLAGTPTKPRIGPELQFGHVMGDHFDAPVLLIKTAWGGKSLAVDFRPPTSGKLTAEVSPKVKDAIAAGTVKVGHYYRQMLTDTRNALKDLKKHFPYTPPAGGGPAYEIVGLAFHQGWNDGCSASYSAEYAANLANFIRDVRKDFSVKNLPVVIASSGFGGNDPNLPGVRARIKKVVEPAQIAVAKKLPNVTCIETRGFFRPRAESPTGASYHWNSNAETYFLIGHHMAKAMINLLAK